LNRFKLKWIGNEIRWGGFSDPAEDHFQFWIGAGPQSGGRSSLSGLKWPPVAAFYTGIVFAGARHELTPLLHRKDGIK
jgi:hypothetical protein